MARKQKAPSRTASIDRQVCEAPDGQQHRIDQVNEVERTKLTREEFSEVVAVFRILNQWYDEAKPRTP